MKPANLSAGYRRVRRTRHEIQPRRNEDTETHGQDTETHGQHTEFRLAESPEFSRTELDYLSANDLARRRPAGRRRTGSRSRATHQVRDAQGELVCAGLPAVRRASAAGPSQLDPLSGFFRESPWSVSTVREVPSQRGSVRYASYAEESAPRNGVFRLKAEATMPWQKRRMSRWKPRMSRWKPRMSRWKPRMSRRSFAFESGSYACTSRCDNRRNPDRTTASARQAARPGAFRVDSVIS